jgi:hypothetical protein
MHKTIFVNSKKAYVGVEHGKSVSLSQSDAKQLMKIVNQYGAYYEGNGGDISAIKEIPKSAYRGSWDDLFAKQVKGYPFEFLYTIFTNTEENNQKKHLVSQDKTILEMILKAQNKIGFFKDKKFTSDTLNKFLQGINESGVDFVEMAQEKATKANVEKFLSAGEELMWPNEDWEDYPNKAGKMAKKANSQRYMFVANQDSGVYVMGSDNIKEIQRIKPGKKIFISSKKQISRSMISNVSLS